MISWEDQLAIFLRLTNKEQSDMLNKLEHYDMNKLSHALLSHLDLEQKAAISTQWDAPMRCIFETISKQEQTLFFITLDLNSQHQILEKLIESKQLKTLNMLLDHLLFEQKVNMIKHASRKGSIQFIIAIFKHLSEEQRLEMLQERDMNRTLMYNI